MNSSNSEKIEIKFAVDLANVEERTAFRKTLQENRPKNAQLRWPDETTLNWDSSMVSGLIVFMAAGGSEVIGNSVKLLFWILGRIKSGPRVSIEITINGKKFILKSDMTEAQIRKILANHFPSPPAPRKP